ncbi:type VI secretion system baseplate subunit TssG [Chitiniphilus shinanonensis]
MRTDYGRFNVFQLVRLLRWKPRAHDAHGRRLPLAVYRMDDRVRFRGDLSAAFPGREVTGLQPRPPHTAAPERRHGAPERIDLATANYCVAGELGPLPEPYTEWVRDQQRAGSPAFAAFLDLFNHRMNVLRHNLKGRQEIAVNHLYPSETRYAQYLGALMGVGLPELAQQLPLPARAWLGLAGLMANCRRTGATVEHVLGQYLGVPVRLTQMVGAWRKLEDGDRQLLGRRGNRLGQTCLLGGRVWDQQARVRLTVDPLPYARVAELLPGASLAPSHPPRDPAEAARQRGEGAGHGAFVALVAFLLDRRFDVEVVFQVLDDSIPPRPLGAGGMRLSRSAWLPTHREQLQRAAGQRRLGTDAWLSAPRAPREVRVLLPAFGVAS